MDGGHRAPTFSLRWCIGPDWHPSETTWGGVFWTLEDAATEQVRLEQRHPGVRVRVCSLATDEIVYDTGAVWDDFFGELADDRAPVGARELPRRRHARD